MIIVTGAAGFIGSCLLRKLNDEGHRNLILVDDFSREDKNQNLKGKNYIARVHRDLFPEWLERMRKDVDFIFHLGARTDTAEQDVAIFDRLNLHYTQRLWEISSEAGIPILYASSAATYGLGEHGYKDDHDIIDQLKPLNPYGRSKNDFDKWAFRQKEQPPYWAGIKFFNVYGPNEYHKGRMASVILHTHRQIEQTGKMKLFRSHRPDVKNGEQQRDFVYVKDVVNVLYFLYQHRPANGLYNLGTGKARTFWDLAAGTFRAMNLDPAIDFIDTPEDIRDTYQYFTEADMSKLRQAGYTEPFHTLEEGIRDYVQEYLMKKQYW
jgi:ADP-L-glycero-D-manno-heptose 6-epimerase